MKNIKIFLLFSAVNIFTAFSVKAQDKTPEEVKKILESQNYVFKANMAYPERGKSRDLTPEYDLTITPKSIISYLPYFGRAYAAPMPSSEGGIKFTSADFEYSTSKKKKSLEITIKLKDVSDVRELYLSIYDNGNANLRVVSTNREGISFSGYIKEGKPQ